MTAAFAVNMTVVHKISNFARSIFVVVNCCATNPEQIETRNLSGGDEIPERDIGMTHMTNSLR